MLSVLAACLLAIMSPAMGQSNFQNTPNIVTVNHQLTAPFSSSLNDLVSAVGMPSCFTLEVEQESLPIGAFTRQRLRVFYNNVPLRVARLQASAKTSNGKYKGVVNGYYPDYPTTNFPSGFDTTPSLTESALKTAVVNFINAQDNVPAEVGSVSVSDLQYFSFEKQIDVDVLTGDVQLVYSVRSKVDIVVSNGAYIRFPRGLVRVADGLVDRMDLFVLKASGNTACPKANGGSCEFPGYTYGPGSKKVCLNAKKVGSWCYYENDHVVIYDALNSYDRSTAVVKSFKCNKGPDDESNGAFSPSSDAFYYSQQFYGMLNSWTGMSNINNEPIGLFVHFGDQYPNSFYDGECLSFGDGTALTYPLTIAESIGHELAHALTDGFGSLEMGLEAVALNEAFSDILGKGVTVFDTDVLDWRFARGFIRNADALRYFDNPPQDGIAIDHLNDFSLGVSRGVYSLMGVYTKFMYELVDQQNVSYEDGVNVLVFANRIYWNEESSFKDGACGIMRAARDLGESTSSFQSAFSSVGIDVSFCAL